MFSTIKNLFVQWKDSIDVERKEKKRLKCLLKIIFQYYSLIAEVINEFT